MNTALIGPALCTAYASPFAAAQPDNLERKQDKAVNYKKIVSSGAAAASIALSAIVLAKKGVVFKPASAVKLEEKYIKQAGQEGMETLKKVFENSKSRYGN